MDEARGCSQEDTDRMTTESVPTTSARTRWLGLIAIAISVSLIVVDGTIVAVAMPSIVTDLGLSSSQLQWVQESYTLMFASLLLVFGAIADRFGRRRLLVLGLILFAIASIGISLSTDGNVMIAWRVLQGIGGAMILPTTLSLINANFTGRDRAIAFAVWGGMIGGMSALGPLLGGWLTTAFSWHWAFLINPPLVLLVIAAVLAWVPETRSERGGRLDLVGAGISTVAMAGLVFGLIEGRTYGWWMLERPFAMFGLDWTLTLSPVPIAFAVAALALTLFLVRSVRRTRAGKPNLLTLSLFGIPSFRNGNVVAMLVSLGEFGIILTLPLWLQNVLGYDALQAGLALLPLAIGSFIASGAVTSLSQRMPAVAIVRLGLALEIAGLLVVALSVGTETPWWPITIGLGLYGVGVGFATAQLTGTILADVPRELSGEASGTQSTARQLGSALGIAILGSLLFGLTGTNLSNALTDHGVPPEQATPIVQSVTDSAGAVIPSLEQRAPDDYAAATEAFAAGTRAAAFASVGALTIALIATSSLGNISRTSARKR